MEGVKVACIHTGVRRTPYSRDHDEIVIRTIPALPYLDLFYTELPQASMLFCWSLYGFIFTPLSSTLKLDMADENIIPFCV